MSENRIRHWRDVRNLTLEQLAEQAGMSTSYLQRMESGSRNVSLKNLAKLSQALGVTPRDLVENSANSVPVVGFVGAGAAAHLFSDGQGPFDEVPAPDGSTTATVAVVIRGESLGSIFDGWLVFYDAVRDPPSSDLVGKLCVLGVAGGKVLIKKLQKGQLPKRFNLLSATEPPLYDVQVDWAAAVKLMTPP